MAVDIPSGLDCQTGAAARHTFRADHTCTFVAAKPGLVATAAQPWVGQLHVLDIGAPSALLREFGIHETMSVRVIRDSRWETPRMPIYEYVCRKCRHEFEVLVRGNEQPECPQCGDRKLDKLLSVPAAHVREQFLRCHRAASTAVRSRRPREFVRSPAAWAACGM